MEGHSPQPGFSLCTSSGPRTNALPLLLRPPCPFLVDHPPLLPLYHPINNIRIALVSSYFPFQVDIRVFTPAYRKTGSIWWQKKPIVSTNTNSSGLPLAGPLISPYQRIRKHSKTLGVRARGHGCGFWKWQRNGRASATARCYPRTRCDSINPTDNKNRT